MVPDQMARTPIDAGRGAGEFSSTTIHTIVNRSEFINYLRSLLTYHMSCGIHEYPAGEEVKNGLQLCAHPAADAGTTTDDRLTDQTPSVKTVADRETRGQMTEPRSISELKTDIDRCQNCSLHATRQVSTAGNGGINGVPVKLLIVGDWLTVTDRSPVNEGDLFGRDQDQMLSRMIGAIDLVPEHVFITNVIKCSIPETCQPTAEHIISCSNHLKMQIEILSPRLICVMGIIASRLLTNQAKPLSQQRGRFFSYKTDSGIMIPVMPTYHPTFLLQNPEMKKAAWVDLQAIKQKLKGSP